VIVDLVIWGSQVKSRNARSLKVMKAAPVRTRRLARDMIIFWKKWDKEQVRGSCHAVHLLFVWTRMDACVAKYQEYFLIKELALWVSF
jgi:hypothetical protein